MKHSKDPPGFLKASDENLPLMQRAQSGDFVAFEELIEKLRTRVYSVAFRILGKVQDSEDVVQQTFLSMIENIESFRGESTVATWVSRIAANYSLKKLRNARTHPTQSLDNQEDSYSSVPHPEFIAEWKNRPDELAQRNEFRRLLDQAIAELDEKYRVVFVLRDIEEMSTEETANTLGISQSNVKIRLLRARMQLRERLTKEFGASSTRVYPNHSH